MEKASNKCCTLEGKQNRPFWRKLDKTESWKNISKEKGKKWCHNIQPEVRFFFEKQFIHFINGTHNSAENKSLHTFNKHPEVRLVHSCVCKMISATVRFVSTSIVTGYYETGQLIIIICNTLKVQLNMSNVTNIQFHKNALNAVENVLKMDLKTHVKSHMT